LTLSTQTPLRTFSQPASSSAPDIDLDFADTRREEVIQYVTRKYGVDKVAQIITFGTMEAKGSVRDVGRALGMPYSGPDRISKMIPLGWQGHAMTLEKAMQENPELKQAYLNEPETKKLIDLSKRIEGVVRHSSVHAAGVVIADAPITDYCPVQRETTAKKSSPNTISLSRRKRVGLLKMDFLGLRNLTIIEESLKSFAKIKISILIFQPFLSTIKKHTCFSPAEKLPESFNSNPPNAPVYQELQPTNIFDVMAMVALYARTNGQYP